MGKFLLIANWKANKTIEEAKTWLNELLVHRSQFTVDTRLEIAIAAPDTVIPTLPSEFTRVSQDLSAFPVGAYTGEVPARLLAGLGVKYSLIGHSERRKYLHETNIEVEAKMKQAIDNEIIPIICAQTLEEIPANIRNYPSEKFLVMYEPFSAISTDGQYLPESPEKVAAVLVDWKNKLNLDCRFLYGGSVNPNDQLLFQSLMTNDQSLLSGFVVGHASLAAETFFVIIKKCLQNLPSV